MSDSLAKIGKRQSGNHSPRSSKHIPAYSALDLSSFAFVGNGAFSFGLRLIDSIHFLSALSSSERVPVQSRIPSPVEEGTGCRGTVVTEGLKSISGSSWVSSGIEARGGEAGKICRVGDTRGDKDDPEVMSEVGVTSRNE